MNQDSEFLSLREPHSPLLRKKRAEKFIGQCSSAAYLKRYDMIVKIINSLLEWLKKAHRHGILWIMSMVRTQDVDICAESGKVAEKELCYDEKNNG